MHKNGEKSNGGKKLEASMEWNKLNFSTKAAKICVRFLNPYIIYINMVSV